MSLAKVKENWIIDPVAQPSDGVPLEGRSPDRSLSSAKRSMSASIVASRATWIVVIGVLAVLARVIALKTANDLFIDEITYTNISNNVAHGHGVVLYGQPFALHPPAVFGLFALAILVCGLHGTTESILFALRNLDVVIGATTCVLTFLLVDRVANRKLAVVAALIIAVDPLVTTYDSRVMLEAPTQLATVSAFLFLAVAVSKPVGASRLRWLFSAGMSSAVVFCMKETFGLVVGIALIALVITGWVIRRREAAMVLGVGLVGYGICVVIMGLSYGFGIWWQNQSAGVSRLVGKTQLTGFEFLRRCMFRSSRGSSRTYLPSP